MISASSIFFFLAFLCGVVFLVLTFKPDMLKGVQDDILSVGASVYFSPFSKPTVPPGYMVKNNMSRPEPPVIQFGLDKIYKPGGAKNRTVSD